MKKLFNVVADMDTQKDGKYVMTPDQLRGAIRNMEPLANTLHDAFNELVKNHEDEHYDSVLDLDFDNFDDDTLEFYLPGLNGGLVIIGKARLDSLLRWKLEFFAKYGNLKLNVLQSDVNSTYIGLDYSDRMCEGYVMWQEAKLELERSSAALYESMRNVK